MVSCVGSHQFHMRPGQREHVAIVFARLDGVVIARPADRTLLQQIESTGVEARKHLLLDARIVGGLTRSGAVGRAERAPIALGLVERAAVELLKARLELRRPHPLQLLESLGAALIEHVGEKRRARVVGHL